ncbi:MAG: hypothetical protein JNL97_01085 [Verrucomicrobiales bacterium]|nr:hypothetical protein [Verrucomicrobiales bacterium]
MKTRVALRVGDPSTPHPAKPAGAAGIRSLQPSAGTDLVGDARSVPVPRTSRRSRPGKWLEEVTRPAVCVGVVAVSVCLLAVAAALAPRSAGAPTRQGAATGSATIGADPAPTVEVLNDWRAAAERVGARLAEDRAVFAAVLEAIETAARRREWKLELTVSPPMEPVAGLAALIAYPVSVQLMSATAGEAPDFGEVLDWLEETTRLERAVEVTGLDIDTTRANRPTIRVDFRVFGRQEHDAKVPH